MFLLIPVALLIDAIFRLFFTFQYVSINTGIMNVYEDHLADFTFQYVSINTNWDTVKEKLSELLYIPICFY